MLKQMEYQDRMLKLDYPINYYIILLSSSVTEFTIFSHDMPPSSI